MREKLGQGGWRCGREERARDGVKRSEEEEMSRRIRGGQHFDLGRGALVFTFNTAERISPSSLCPSFHSPLVPGFFHHPTPLLIFMFPH